MSESTWTEPDQAQGEHASSPTESPLVTSPDSLLWSVFSFQLPSQENINIDEAANCLVKHIIASEKDMLQSEVPDTVSPQLEKDKSGTCSSCFRSQ